MLAYLASSPVMKKRACITLTTGANVKNVFSLSLMDRQNKLECLPWLVFFQASLVIDQHSQNILQSSFRPGCVFTNVNHNFLILLLVAKAP
jgi:hypothetical protein